MLLPITLVDTLIDLMHEKYHNRLDGENEKNTF